MAGVTFGDVAKDWTDGELHERFPDHIKASNLDSSKLLLDKYVQPPLTRGGERDQPR